MRDAACGEAENPEIFFPTHGNTVNTPEAKAAKEYCLRCTVRQKCLEFAQPHGIWGGLTAVERSHVPVASL